jgi:hypothetical protein
MRNPPSSKPHAVRFSDKAPEPDPGASLFFATAMGYRPRRSSHDIKKHSQLPIRLLKIASAIETLASGAEALFCGSNHPSETGAQLLR